MSTARNDMRFEIVAGPDGRLIGRFPALAALPGLAHAVTTRDGPAFGAQATDPRTADASRALALALGLRDVTWLHQVHGADVVSATDAGLAGDGDALLCTSPGRGVLGRSADCPLILVAAPPATPSPSPSGWAVGMAHASWRSTVAGITGRLIAELVLRCGASPAWMVAGICPSAGPCCYEVGPEVRDAALAGIGSHAGAFFDHRAGRLFFDLWRANVDQLARAGVPTGQIHVAGLCTLCRNDLFPSHRREGGAAARFAAIIGVQTG